jgi:tRNA1(Val) A37 N6-methylase TrmN6
MTFKKHNIEPKRVQFIHPKPGKEANILLIEGKKDGNIGLKVLNPEYSHQQDGRYTDFVLKQFSERTD